MVPSTHGIILAAGEGSRMNSDRPKVLHRCFGEPMIHHVHRSLDRSDVADVTAVLGTGIDRVRSELPEGVGVVEQTEQLGTGHAVEQALDGIEFDADDIVLVACGDIPGVRPATYSRVLDAVRGEGDADLAVLAATVEDPAGYGRVLTHDGDKIDRIVEHKDATAEERDVDLINTGIICARASVFERLIPRLSNDNAAGEYYLTDVVEQVGEEDGVARAIEADNEWEITGINTRRQLVEFEREGYRRRNNQLLDNGVTVHDLDRVKIGPWVDLGKDVELEGEVTVHGVSTIGRGTRLSGIRTI